MYNINVVSQKNAIILIFGLIVLFFLVLTLLLPFLLNNQVLFYFIVILIGVLGYFLWQKLVRGLTTWRVDEFGISITWVKNFIADKRDDVLLNWSDITSVNEEFVRHYYQLNIQTKIGDVIKFYISRSTSRADFDNLLKEINERLS
jgi:hypothetical protein